MVPLFLADTVSLTALVPVFIIIVSIPTIVPETEVVDEVSEEELSLELPSESSSWFGFLEACFAVPRISPLLVIVELLSAYIPNKVLFSLKPEKYKSMPFIEPRPLFMA